MLKFKKISKNKYKITIDGNTFILYEDVILKYNILSKTSISKNDINLYKKDNEFYNFYYMSISYLNKKFRCEKEIVKYLKSKNGDNKIISSVIAKLKERNYLNDQNYINFFIKDKINFTSYGPKRIKKELELLGLNNNLVNDYIDEYFNNELIDSRINNYITKKIKNNKTKSTLSLKQSILNDLINLGYEKDDILDKLNNISYNDDDVYQKEYEKIKRNLAKKYHGEELNYKLKQKLYLKGFKKQE